MEDFRGNNLFNNMKGLDNIIVTQNKDYILEFNRITSGLFSNLTRCNIKIYNNIGIVMKDLMLSESDAIILLDNLYYFLDTGEDTVVSLNSTTDIYGITSMVKIYNIYEKNYNLVATKMDILQLYDGLLTPILSFEITDNFPELCNMLYYIFVVPSNDIDSKTRLDPDYILESY